MIWVVGNNPRLWLTVRLRAIVCCCCVVSPTATGESSVAVKICQTCQTCKKILCSLESVLPKCDMLRHHVVTCVTCVTCWDAWVETKIIGSKTAVYRYEWMVGKTDFWNRCDNMLTGAKRMNIVYLPWSTCIINHYNYSTTSPWRQLTCAFYRMLHHRQLLQPSMLELCFVFVFAILSQGTGTSTVLPDRSAIIVSSSPSRRSHLIVPVIWSRCAHKQGVLDWRLDMPIYYVVRSWTRPTSYCTLAQHTAGINHHHANILASK